MQPTLLRWRNLNIGIDNFKEQATILSKHFLHCKRRLLKTYSVSSYF